MQIIESWQKLIAEEEIEEILSTPREKRMEKLMEYSQWNEADLMEVLSKQYEIQILREFEMLPKPTEHIPLRLLLDYHCIPIEMNEMEITVTSGWPPEPQMNEWIFAICGKRIIWKLSRSNQISQLLTNKFGVGSGSLSDEDLDVDDIHEEEMVDEENEDAAIVKFVNEVISRAVDEGATDIHFEPEETSLQIRQRIDGDLIPLSLPANLVRFQSAIVSRLKIMAKLNISEKRRPQDGRITFRANNNDFDVRISTFPTMFGESISLRLLNQKKQPLTMTELGMLNHDKEKILSILKKPHGIILVTGPTGSGKSTSLSTFIRQINVPEKRIITVEDPIEYEIPKVNQTQIHSEIGLSFANALRHILRQDPDIIMVGEIRDQETAEIAIRASLTGHLVLSTLHTNDAAGAISRLSEMEIDPFLIASSIELVIAQRLIRRLCPKCSKPSDITPEMLKSTLIALEISSNEEQYLDKIRISGGCESCRNMGYRGRVGVFELLVPDEKIKDMIVKNASAREINQVALANGMMNLKQSGWEQVKVGNTCLKELLKLDLKLSTET